MAQGKNDSNDALELSVTDVQEIANSPLEKRLRDIRTRQQQTRSITKSDNSGEHGAQPHSDKDTSVEIANHPVSNRTGVRGRTSASVIEQAQLSLFKLEQQGRFTALALRPQSEFPTFLTRIPIFVPGRRTTQRRILDEENALPFSTPWGEGKKHGPPLTVYDEDTLIAIGRLRQNMLIGLPQHMPVPVSDLYKDQDKPDVHVHVLHCMLSDIQQICGTSLGGKNNKLRLDSIKRLGATVIEFDQRTSDKFIGKGTEIKLLDVAWQAYQENAILYIQFSPVMAAWFEKEYTYIDWNLRRKLSDTGKAIHRFLAGQPKSYSIFTKKLMGTIGYPRAYKLFMHNLREDLKRLQEEGWIHSWEIEGNGRRVPHKLTLER